MLRLGRFSGFLLSVAVFGFGFCAFAFAAPIFAEEVSPDVSTTETITAQPTMSPEVSRAAKMVVDRNYYRLSDEEVAGLDLKSQKFYLYDLTDETEFFTRGADEATAVASLTKMMTALVFLENHANDLDAQITITEEMLAIHSEYTKLGLKAGEVVTVRDMLYGLMLPSAADAANALAFYDAGSVEAFVDKMNAKAAALGLSQTHFSNPYGMDEADTIMVYPNSVDPSNYSTARECARILVEALKNGVFREIFNSFTYDTSYGKTIKKSATTHIDRIVGLKTGYTAAAKRCLASISEVDGKEFLLINLGAESTPDHLTDATKLYQFVDDNFDAVKLPIEGATVANVPVRMGSIASYAVRIGEEQVFYLRRGVNANVEAKYEGISEINSGVKKGDQIGTIKITSSDLVLAEIPVMLDIDIMFYDFLIPIAVVVIIALLLLWRKWRA